MFTSKPSLYIFAAVGLKTTGLSTFIKRVNCTTTAEPDWLANLLKTPSQKFSLLGVIEVQGGFFHFQVKVWKT